MDLGFWYDIIDEIVLYCMLFLLIGTEDGLW